MTTKKCMMSPLNNVLMSKVIVVIEKSRIREIHNIMNCSFAIIHRIIHTKLTIMPVCQMDSKDA